MRDGDSDADKAIVTLARAIALVSVQAEVSMDDALNLIFDRAEAEHCSPHDVAVGVIEETVCFGA